MEDEVPKIRPGVILYPGIQKRKQRRNKQKAEILQCSQNEKHFKIVSDNAK